MMESKDEENKENQEIEILIIKLDESILNSEKEGKKQINIEDYKDNIKLQTKLLIKINEKLFCYLFNNEKRIHQILTKESPSTINIYELIMNIKRIIAIKKDK